MEYKYPFALENKPFKDDRIWGNW